MLEVKDTKKRKRKDDLDEDETITDTIQEFEHEGEIMDLYTKNEAGLKFIELEEQEALNGEKLYVSLNVKELLNTLDLKKEVVLTMLNQLQKIGDEKKFFRVDGIIPIGVQMRFHSKSLEYLTGTSKNKEFYQAFLSIASERQGIYRCNLLNLALKLQVKPYNIPKILYGLQHASGDDIAYDLDKESFILEFQKIPHQTHIFDLSEDMLQATRAIEKNMVSKLNCMYFAARKVSIPSIEFMLKKED